MQKWIRKAAHSLAAAQGADQSREDVIAYGLTALCQIDVYKRQYAAS